MTSISPAPSRPAAPTAKAEWQTERGRWGGRESAWYVAESEMKPAFGASIAWSVRGWTGIERNVFWERVDDGATHTKGKCECWLGSPA
eukprot:scaffold7740_cov112-Isochrysis_galbana.AAC.3